MGRVAGASLYAAGMYANDDTAAGNVPNNPAAQEAYVVRQVSRENRWRLLNAAGAHVFDALANHDLPRARLAMHALERVALEAIAADRSQLQTAEEGLRLHAASGGASNDSRTVQIIQNELQTDQERIAGYVQARRDTLAYWERVGFGR